MSKSFALLTGASAGIGFDLAHILAEQGHDVVLTARNGAALEGLAGELRTKHGVRAEVIVADLSDVTAPRFIVDELSRRSISLDTLINNAGFGSQGPFVETDLEREMAMIQVNVGAVVQLTRLLLPQLMVNTPARILNVASTASFVPGPYMSTYYATKAFVLSHSVALARELGNKGVTVTALCPGPTHTEFQKRAGIRESKLFGRKSMAARPVAEAGYRGMMRGELIVVPGASNKLSVFAARFAPQRFLSRFVAKLNKDRKG
jgi:uncharacterized protein